MYCPGITPVAPLRGLGCVGVKVSRHAQNTRRPVSETALATDMMPTWGEGEYRADPQVPFPSGGKATEGASAQDLGPRATLRCGALASAPGNGGAWAVGEIAMHAPALARCAHRPSPMGRSPGR